VKDGEIFGLLGPMEREIDADPDDDTLIRLHRHGAGGGTRRARDPNAVRRTIGVIPQALTSDLDLTVEENLNIYAKLYDVRRSGARKRSTSCWRWSILRSGGRANEDTVSGMRRRLEIARASAQSQDFFSG